MVKIGTGGRNTRSGKAIENLGSLIIQSLKYADDNDLNYENTNGFLKKAFVCLGLETESKRHAQRGAVRNYMKYRISRRRD